MRKSGKLLLLVFFNGCFPLFYFFSFFFRPFFHVPLFPISIRGDTDRPFLPPSPLPSTPPPPLFYRTNMAVFVETPGTVQGSPIRMERAVRAPPTAVRPKTLGVTQMASTMEIADQVLIGIA